MTEDPDSQAAGLELPPGKRTRERLAGTPGGHPSEKLVTDSQEDSNRDYWASGLWNDHKMPM